MKIEALANKTASKNCQLTELRFSVAIDMKMSDGRANVPTNVFKPLASVAEIIFNRPATYLTQKRYN